jgi:two-component system NtrC family sensor kinase
MSALPPEASSLSSVRLLFTAAVLVPLAIVGAAAWLSLRAAENEAARRADRTMEVVREQALRVFGLYQLILDEVDHGVAGASWAQIVGSPEVHTDLRRLQDRAAETSSVFLQAPNGREWASSRQFPMPSIDGSDRDYFQALMAADPRLYVSAPALGRLSGDRFFAVARRRSGGEGRFDGVVGVSGRVEYFEGLYRALLETPADEILMLRDDGTVIVRVSGDERRDRPAPDVPFLRLVLPAERGHVRAVQSDGVARLYAYGRVGDYPVHVAYGLARSAVWAPWLREVAVQALVGLLAASLLVYAVQRLRRQTAREAAALTRWARELERREQAEAALRHAQRLEALGRLTGGVAHDFGNVLHVLKANLAVLARAGDRRLAPQLDAMARAVDQGARLTRQLLSFARRQPLAPVRVDLVERLPAIVELARHSLAPGIEISAAVAPGTWDIHADSDELELAVVNLAVNARDAMPAGGRIAIAARNAADVTEPRGDCPTGDFVAISVRDSGTGIAPEILDKVFDPFFTTKDAGKGTGLGLSQVYGFAEQSGGTVTVKSQPGHGTEVTLWLPRAEPLTAPVPDRTTAA